MDQAQVINTMIQLKLLSDEPGRFERYQAHLESLVQGLQKPSMHDLFNLHLALKSIELSYGKREVLKQGLNLSGQQSEAALKELYSAQDFLAQVLRAFLAQTHTAQTFTEQVKVLIELYRHYLRALDPVTQEVFQPNEKEEKLLIDLGLGASLVDLNQKTSEERKKELQKWQFNF